MKIIFVACGLLCMSVMAFSQEFPKNEFIMHLRLHNGMVTNFKSAPDLYVGGLQLIPQYTVVENVLRVGVIAGGFYTGKKLQGEVGPTVSFKLKTIALKSFGSGGNINLSLDHLWGTEQQRLLGGGLNIDLLNFIIIGVSAHRDYSLNNWWLQASIGARISKVKKPIHP